MGGRGHDDLRGRPLRVLAGTTTVPDPTKFTASFDTDGRASFLLDCNRGNGSYQAQPSSDGVSGTLTFGPIATTMMLCPLGVSSGRLRT